MPRGSKRGQHKGGRRIYTSPEELEAQQRQRKKKDGESEDGDSDEEEDSEESDEDENAVKKGTQGLIEVENLNRMPQKQKKVAELSVLEPAATAELSRREREEIEREAKRKEYERLHQLGKTAEAQADLARLAIVRKEREEAARKREEEKKSKEAVKLTKQAETNIAQGKIDTKKPIKSNEKTTEKGPIKAGSNKPKDGT